jgi:hypothetical protein
LAALPDCFCDRNHLRLPGYKEEEQHQRQAAHCITTHDEPVRLQSAPADCLQPLRQPAARQGAGCRGERPGEIVPAENPGAPAVRDQLGERRLLDGQKGSDLAAAGADDADDRRQGDPHRIVGERKTRPARIISAEPKQEHVLAAHPVSHHGHPEGDQDVTGQRSGENGPNAGCTQTGGGEIERQNNRDEPVGEQPD